MCYMSNQYVTYNNNKLRHNTRKHKEVEKNLEILQNTNYSKTEQIDLKKVENKVNFSIAFVK